MEGCIPYTSETGKRNTFAQIVASVPEAIKLVSTNEVVVAVERYIDCGLWACIVYYRRQLLYVGESGTLLTSRPVVIMVMIDRLVVHVSEMTVAELSMPISCNNSRAKFVSPSEIASGQESHHLAESAMTAWMNQGFRKRLLTQDATPM